MLSKFFKDDSAGSAMEYGLVTGLISIAIVSGVIFSGNVVNNVFNYIGNQISNVLH